MARQASRAAVLGLVVSISATISHAAPTIYHESVGGDLEYNYTTTTMPTFTLDVGANTISGVFGVGDFPDPSDFDHFAFNIPAGLMLTGGQVTLLDTTGNINFSRWDLYDGDVLGGNITANITVDSPGTAAIPARGAGQYSFWQQTVGGVGSSSYTFTLNVAPVPEPATLALLALAATPLLRPRRGA
jgi:hypothetical protein